jgi:integrase
MLTDREIRALAPTAGKAQTWTRVDRALWIVVTRNGDRSWVCRATKDGRSAVVGLGSFPEIGLALARQLRDQVIRQLAAGETPAGPRARAQRAKGDPGTVAALVEEWLALPKPSWSPAHADNVRKLLEQTVIARIGTMAVQDVTGEVLMNRVFGEPMAHAPAQKVRRMLIKIFRRAMKTGRIASNPAAGIEAEDLGEKPASRRQPAVLDLKRLRELVAEVEDTPAFPQVLLAHRLIALTAMRSKEVRLARWDQFVGLDGDTPEWHVPEEQMKMKERGDHVVPLSREAVEVIKAARLFFGDDPYVFPHTSKDDRYISGHSLQCLLKRAGYYGKNPDKKQRHVVDGWRASFSTNMNDQYPEWKDVIATALAHFNHKDRTAAAYNRGAYLQKRRIVMQRWAEMLMANAQPATSLLNKPKRSDLVPREMKEAA